MEERFVYVKDLLLLGMLVFGLPSSKELWALVSERGAVPYASIQASSTSTTF